MFNNIPHELQALPQWVVWKYEQKPNIEKPTKVPYNPLTGWPADVTNPMTWADFNSAVSALANGYSGIGFVFTERDPYAFIDLDTPKCDPEELPKYQETQRKIVEHFNGTYSEISPSGNGLHIIVKGSLLSAKKRSVPGIELYSKERYATFTGNVYGNYPVSDRQELLSRLWMELGGNDTEVQAVDKAQVEEDEAIYNKLIAAKNSSRFVKLWVGDWKDDFPSQSEADQALMNMLGFYTQNHAQLARMFRISALGQREKAKRDNYVKPMITKALDRQVSEDFSALTEFVKQQCLEKINAVREHEENRLAKMREATERRHAEIMATKPPAKVTGDSPFAIVPALAGDFDPPKGLLGKIAKFAYDQAPYPMPRIALSAAIGFMSGLCGRAYNINGAGVNTYTLLVAPTATGKEAMSSAITKLTDAVSELQPNIKKYFGVDYIASGQALYAKIKERKSFLSIQSEFGIHLQALSSVHASPANIMLKQAYLALFSKSGQGQSMGGSAFADKIKDTDMLKSPGFSLLCETAPPHLYDNLTETMLADGFLPRFTLIEVDENSEAYNHTAHKARPETEMVKDLAALSSFCLSLDAKDVAQEVMLHPEAAELAEAYRAASKREANNQGRDSHKQLWSRAHIKALKLAAIIAIGEDWFNPVVSLEAMTWAIQVVNDGIRRLADRFDKGEFGDGDNRQIADVRKFLSRYLTSHPSKLPKANLNLQLHSQFKISYTYLRQNVGALASFRSAKAGATVAFVRTLQALIDCGDIVEMPKDQCMQAGVSGKAYVIVNSALAE